MMKAQYELSMELHRRIEALYPRVEQHGALFRGVMRVDSALPKPPGRSMGVRVDPIVCALAIKAATTKQAVVALCELGDGDNAFALMRVLLENACLLEWLIRGEGHRRLETYVIFTSVVHERIVAVAERFRDRFIAAGADSLPESDPYHRAVAEHVFENPKSGDDRPTREFSGHQGKLNRVNVKEMFDAIKDTEHSFEYQVLYGALGSDIIHSGPFSLSRMVGPILERSMFVLRPTPSPDLCTLALGMSNAAMFLVLDSLNEYVGLGLSEDLAALKAENREIQPAADKAEGVGKVMNSTTSTAKTRGEEVFEKYLNSQGLRFTYEPDLGNRHPDYLVHAPSGDVLCEVKDFEQNDEDKAELEATLAGRNTATFREIPYARIQLRIRAGSKQLREFKGRYPCLVVLFDASAQILLTDFTLLGAMYGETRISVPISRDDDERDAEASTVFDRDSRYLTPTSNTTVSAVAILEHVTPKRRLLDEALARQDFGDGPDRLTRMLKFIYDFGEQHPEVFERVPRLNIFRNQFAAVPWPVAAFSGPHDLLWQKNYAGTKS